MLIIDIVTSIILITFLIIGCITYKNSKIEGITYFIGSGLCAFYWIMKIFS